MRKRSGQQTAVLKGFVEILYSAAESDLTCRDNFLLQDFCNKENFSVNCGQVEKRFRGVLSANLLNNATQIAGIPQYFIN